MTEPTFNVNSLGENKIYTGSRAQFAQIYNLIRMKKGTDPLNPDKGIGIADYYYMFDEASDLMKLENQIYDQIITYTEYRPITVNCTSKKVEGVKVLSVLISLKDFNEVLVVLSNGDNTLFDTVRNEN